jgi:lipoprotein NlpI
MLKTVHCLSLLFILSMTVAAQTTGQPMSQRRTEESISYNDKGLSYARKGEYEMAIQSFKQAIRIRPDNAVAYGNLGSAYAALGKNEEAINSFKQSLRLNPNLVPVQFSLGDLYSSLGQFEEAIKIYSQIIHDHPKFPQPYYNRSYSYLSSGQGAAAAADAQASLNIMGWRNEHSQYMVIVEYFGYRRAGSAADATRVLDEAAAKCDTQAWPYPVIRYLRHEITAQDLIKAVTDNNKMTEARAYIGLDLSLAGHQQEALEQFQWVEANGKRTYLEYRLALAEMRRLKNTDVKSQQP